MTLLEVANMIEEMNIVFAYRAFEEGTAQEPPFICYMYNGNTPEPADDTNYVKIEQLAIELYTDNKNFALEQQVEDVLTSHDLVFSREETWLDDEKMQMTTYLMEVQIDGTE